MQQKQAVHIRRCHICGCVSEREGALVDHCHNCGKPIAPFYFFDDFTVKAYTDYGERPEPEEDSAGHERLPIRGFSAVW